MDVARPWLGFVVKEDTEQQKVFITDVAKGGPADVSQIKVGEELVSMGELFYYNFHKLVSQQKPQPIFETECCDLIFFCFVTSSSGNGHSN